MVVGFKRLGAAVVFIAAAGAALADTPTIKGNSISGMRDARYCEIIPVKRDGFHLDRPVYNTLGLNDCPRRGGTASPRTR